MNSRLLIASVLCAGLQAASAGDVVGTITLEGTPPAPPPPIDMSSAPDCAKQHSTPPQVIFYKVGANNSLGDVVISVQNVSKSDGESAPPLMLDQKGCEYVPYVSAVQTGQKIIVKNSDPVLHNIHTLPVAPGNESKAKNLAQPAGGSDISLSFPAAEDFLRIKCDVHPWMFAYVSVVDNPYFAVSDKDGKFKISNLPPGKYTIQAAHRKAGKVSKEVEVKDGSTTVDFTLSVPK